MADASAGIKGQLEVIEDLSSSSVGAAQADDDGMIRTKDILLKEDPGLTNSHAIGMGPDQLTNDSLESSTLLQDSLQEIQETNRYYIGADAEKMCTESGDISTSSHNVPIGEEQAFQIDFHDSQFPNSSVIFITSDALASSSEGNLFSFPIEDLQQKDISAFTDGAFIFIRSEDISAIQYIGEGAITSEIPLECFASPQTSVVYPSASEILMTDISDANGRKTDILNVDQQCPTQTLEIKTVNKGNTVKEEVQSMIETFNQSKESVSINHPFDANLGDTHSSTNTFSLKTDLTENITLSQNNASANETLFAVKKDISDDMKDLNKASLSMKKDGDFDQVQKSSETLMVSSTLTGKGSCKDGTDNKSKLDNNNEHGSNEMPISQPVAVNTEILKIKENIVLMDENAISTDKQQPMVSSLNMNQSFHSSQILMNTSPTNDPTRDKRIVLFPMITSQGTGTCTSQGTGTCTPQVLVAKNISTDEGKVAVGMMPSPCQSKSSALPLPRLSTNEELRKCTQGFKLPYHMAGKKLVIIQCKKPSSKAEIKPFEKISSQKLVTIKGKDSTQRFVIPSHGVVATQGQSILKTNKYTSNIVSKVDAATETDESFLRQQKHMTGIGHMDDQSKKSQVLHSFCFQDNISKSSEVTESRKDGNEGSESIKCMNKEAKPKKNACIKGQEVGLVLGDEEDDFHFQGKNLTTQSSKERKISKKEDRNGDIGRSEEKGILFVKPFNKEPQKSIAAHMGIGGSFRKDKRKNRKHESKTVESKTDNKVKNMNEDGLKAKEHNVSSIRNDSIQIQSDTKRNARRPRVDYKNLNSGGFSGKRVLQSTVFEKSNSSSQNAAGCETAVTKQSRNKMLHPEEYRDKVKSQKSVHLNSKLSKKGERRGIKGKPSQSLPETGKVEKRKGRDDSDDKINDLAEDEMSSSLEVKCVRKRSKLQCKFKACGKVFPNESKLNHHVDIEHNGFVSVGATSDKDLKDEPQTVICKWCEKPYASFKSLAAHRKCCKMSPHTRPKPHICEICGKGFATSLYLKQHAAVHTGIKKYICKVCNKGFSNQGNLYTHLGIHNPNKRFLCAHCGKGFSQHVNLKYHLKTAVGKCASDRKDCPFACEKCGNRFTSYKRLKQHEQIHQKYKIESFSCEHCKRVFKSYPLLERHVRIHTGIKPFKCEVCKMAFAQQNNLEAHVLTHSDVRPYHCAICRRGFIQRTNFKTHMWKKHGLAPNILPRMRTKSRKKDANNPAFQFILAENETHTSISQGQWTQTVDNGTDTDSKSLIEDLRS